MDKRARYPFTAVEARWRQLAPAPAGPAPQQLITWLPPGPEATGGLGWLRTGTVVDTLASYWAARGQRCACTPVEAAATPPRTAAPEAAGPFRSAFGWRHWADPIRPADPQYYRFTQWLFLQLFLYGLVRRVEGRREHCSRCGRLYPLGSLATCKHCGGELSPRAVTEWKLDLGQLADRALQDVEKTGLPAGERAAEQHFLGRTRGFEVHLPASRMFADEYVEITAFTPTIERIYGATFLLLEPYHPLLDVLLDPAYEDDVQRYRERLRKGSEPRISAARTGAFVLNPANLKRVPVLVSPLASRAPDGVLLSVPAHDADLFELARRQKLAIREVIHNERARLDSQLKLEEPWLGDGVLTNSGPYSTLPIKTARDRIFAALSRRGVCQRANRFRRGELVLASASAWGPPVPIIHCKRCGLVPLSDADLPLSIPAEALGSGGGAAAAPPKPLDGPLAPFRTYLRTTCPNCREGASRDPFMIEPWLGEALSFAVTLTPGWQGRIEGFRDPTAPALPAAAALEPAAGSGPVGTTDDSFSEADDLLAPDLDREAPLDDAGAEDDAFEDAEGDGDGDEEDLEYDGAAEGAGVDGDDDGGVEDDGDDDDGEGGVDDDGEGDGEDEGEGDDSQDDGRDVVDGVNDAGDAGTGSAGDAPAAGIGPAPGVAAAQAAKPVPSAASRPKSEDARGRPDEPEDVALAAEDEPDSPLERLSRLKPFAAAAWKAAPPFDVAVRGPGGAERDVLHARMVCKFLQEIGQVPFAEPFARVESIASLSATPPRGAGNAAPPGATPAFAPLDAVERFGADATRLAILFAGPLARPASIDVWAVARMRRLLDRIWRQVTLRRERGKFVSRRMLVNKHFLIHDVTRRLAAWKPHTAVAALMRFVRFLEDPETAPEDMDRGAMRTFLILLYPFAPFLARELWSLMGEEHAIESVPWPVASEELIHPSEREFPIYVDGRIVDRMTQPAGLEVEKLESRALSRDKVRERIGASRVARVVVVPARLVSIVIEGR